MREIPVSVIADTIRNLCIDANQFLPASLAARLRESVNREQSSLARETLCDLCRNLDAAKEMNVPICQDTGMAVVFLEMGQDVHFVGGDLTEAVNLGVSRGYLEGYLRCSVVSDPVRRDHNTGDNTPAILHLSMVPGEQVRITVAPKGFGSENMSAVRMLTPSAGPDRIVSEVTEIVRTAGGNPCPPIVVGVGIGGDFEQSALLSKQALCRDVSIRHPDPFYADLEQRMLDSINALGIGPQGFGGNVTALAVNIETAPTHIAGLPLAVNIGCHVTRHRTAVI